MHAQVVSPTGMPQRTTYLSVAQVSGLLHPKRGFFVVLLAALAVVVGVRDVDAALDMVLPTVVPWRVEAVEGVLTRWARITG